MIFLSFLLCLFCVNVVVSDRLTAYIVPHSHCDPGWTHPIQYFYKYNVTRIIDSVIDNLVKEPYRRFVWAEVVYFQMWWDKNATERQKQIVKKLVLSGQLNFVAGGWVSNDECVTTHSDTIVQMTAGHQFLQSTLGIKPKISWQIDPFGGSRTQPDLVQQMGYEYHIINRVDARLKFKFSNIPHSGKLKEEKNLQFWWYPNPKSNPSESIFSEILYDHYAFPTSFDFEWDQTLNPPITKKNLKERSMQLANILTSRNSSYRTPLIFVPFGDDFRYQNASWQFHNIDQLVKEIHSNPEHYGLDIRYSTLEEYFTDLKGYFLKPNEDEKLHHFERSTKSLFPIKNDSSDFIPYVRCSSEYAEDYGPSCIIWWNGFYSSYPIIIKRYVRDADEFLRTVEILDALLWASPLLPPLDPSITELRRTLSLMQHHDLITGTFTQNVRTDSIEKMYKAVNDTIPIYKSLWITHLSSGDPERKKYLEKNLHVHRSSQDKLIAFFDEEHHRIAVTLFNPLSIFREEVINFTISVPHTTPLDFTRMITIIEKPGQDYKQESVVYDIIERCREEESITYEVFFLAKIEPLGFRTFYLLNSTFFPVGRLDVHSALTGMPCEVWSYEPGQNTLFLVNEYYELKFVDGVLNRVNLTKLNKKEDLETIQMFDITQNFYTYTGNGDETYRFRPKSPASKVSLSHLNCSAIKGTFVEEIKLKYIGDKSESKYNDLIVQEQSFRVFKEGSMDIQGIIQYDTVVHLSKNHPKKEVITRFETSTIKNNKKLIVDTNGYGEIIRDPYDGEYWNDTSFQSLQAGNYFPMTSLAGIKSIDDTQTPKKEVKLIVFSKSSLGVASQENGCFEIMLARNTNDSYPDGNINTWNYSPISHSFWIYLSSFKISKKGGGEEDNKLWNRFKQRNHLSISVVFTKMKGKDDVGFNTNFNNLFPPKKTHLEFPISDEIRLLTLRRNEYDSNEVLLRFENLNNTNPVYANLKWNEAMFFKMYMMKIKMSSLSFLDDWEYHEESSNFDITHQKDLEEVLILEDQEKRFEHISVLVNPTRITSLRFKKWNEKKKVKEYGSIIAIIIISSSLVFLTCFCGCCFTICLICSQARPIKKRINKIYDPMDDESKKKEENKNSDDEEEEEEEKKIEDDEITFYQMAPDDLGGMDDEEDEETRLLHRNNEFI